MTSRRILSLLVGAAALALPATASAQWENPLSFLSGEWTITARGNVVASPKYPGSDEFSVFGFPSFKARRAGTLDTFGTPDDPISLALIRSGGLRIGPSFRYVGSRSSSDDIELLGLNKMPWTVEAGAFVEYWPTEFIRGRVDVRYGFHGHKGVVADFGADGLLRPGAWTLALGPRMRIASSGYQNAYFTVTTPEAIGSGLPVYKAGAGVNSLGLAGSASYKFNPQWEVTGYARYDRLVSDAADSPITRVTGSPNQWTFGAIVGYSFDVRIP